MNPLRNLLDRLWPREQVDGWHTTTQRRKEADVLGWRWRLTMRDADSPMGRFGSGWQWQLGVRVARREAIVDLLVASLRVQPVPQEHLLQLAPGLWRADGHAADGAPHTTTELSKARRFNVLESAETVRACDAAWHPDARVVTQVRPIRPHGGTP